jgi:steroid 5-alpha reductase family enzyme
MSTFPVALWGLAWLLVAFTLLWGLSLRLRDASIADPFWGPGFVLVAVAYVWAGGGTGSRGLMLLTLVGLWAARLGLHLLVRNRSHGEDPRYAAMRDRHGKSFPARSLVVVFWLQAVLVWVVSAPILGGVTSSAPIGAWDAAGAAVSLLGLAIEAMADAQLARFRADPDSRGKVLDTGLWRFSRHPNYFGDAVFWWGLAVIALAGGSWWSPVGPLVMTGLLLKVSGVTLLEEGLRRSRPGYEAYVRRTSAFVPWFPRK